MKTKEKTTRIRVPEDKKGELHHYLLTEDFPTGPFGSKTRTGTVPVCYSGGREGFIHGEGAFHSKMDYEYGFSIIDIGEGAREDTPGQYIEFSGKMPHEVSRLVKHLGLEVKA